MVEWMLLVHVVYLLLMHETHSLGIDSEALDIVGPNSYFDNQVMKSSSPSSDFPCDQVTRNMTRSKCMCAGKPTYPTPSSRWPHGARDYPHAGSLTGQHRTQMIGPEPYVAYTVATLRNVWSRLYPRGIVVSQKPPGTRRASEKRDDAWGLGDGARHAGIRVIPPS